MRKRGRGIILWFHLLMQSLAASVCALTRDQTRNLGTSGCRSNPLSNPARAALSNSRVVFILQYRLPQWWAVLSVSFISEAGPDFVVHEALWFGEAALGKISYRFKKRHKALEETSTRG